MTELIKIEELCGTTSNSIHKTRITLLLTELCEKHMHNILDIYVGIQRYRYNEYKL
jgi:hypothetical protein